MDRTFDVASLLAVILMVCVQLWYFNLWDSYTKGPLNPYVYFTDGIRVSLEKASDKALNGELSDDEARELLKRYDVRRCEIYDGAVGWEIPYAVMPFSVEYIYSPDKPCPAKGGGYSYSIPRSIGNDWYWRRLR